MIRRVHGRRERNDQGQGMATMDGQGHQVGRKPVRGNRNADENTAVGWMVKDGLATQKTTKQDHRDSLARLVWSIMEGEQDIRSYMSMQTNC